MNVPIVLTAFGTTTRAMETYDVMDGVFREAFPETDIRWAYSSRMVRDRVRALRNIDFRHPHELLADLAAEGRRWAVVQSLHIMCGHEFYRLIEEIRDCAVRTSVGLPLLASFRDYARVARILENDGERSADEALVLVGHGTDHPSWSCYLAMNQVFAETVGTGAHVGMIEGECLSPDEVLERVLTAGHKRVLVAPMMLVAGIHFKEDITGGDDSWQAMFEKAGISVRIAHRGLGLNPAIVRVFCDHAREALDAIPRRGA